MATEKVKGGYKVKLKGGGLGKTTFKTQKAAQSRSRGAVKKGKPKGKPRGKGAKGGKSNPATRSAPKIGSLIQGAKGTHALAAPLIEEGITAADIGEAATNLRGKAGIPLASSLIVEGVSQTIDKKLAHAMSLTGGSATAWLAEFYLGWEIFKATSQEKEVKPALRTANEVASKALRGYSVAGDAFSLSDPRFRLYQGIKIGGGIVRRVSNTRFGRRIFGHAKSFLAEMGGRL